MVPSLVALGFSRHRANGTSLAAIVLVALSGAIAFAFAGDVDWQVGATLGIGGLIGSTLGAHLMNRLTGNTLGLIFGIVLLITGLRMVLAGDSVVGGGEIDGAARSRHRPFRRFGRGGRGHAVEPTGPATCTEDRIQSERE